MGASGSFFYPAVDSAGASMRLPKNWRTSSGFSTVCVSVGFTPSSTQTCVQARLKW